MGIINETHQFDKNAIEIDMYAPHSEIKSIVNLIRELVKLVRISIEEVKYPWDERRMNLMLFEIVQLVGYQIEQIEGVICLAETNLYHYTSAFVISRTVLEINLVLEWLLKPEDESERVLRYISYLKGQFITTTYDDYISNSNLPIQFKDELRVNINQVNEKDIPEMTQAAKDYYGISSERIVNLKKIPIVTELLKDISPIERQNSLKTTYYVLSKFTHGMRHSIYRYYDPNFSSYVPVPDWQYPLYICYESIIASTRQLLKRFTDNLEKFNINLKPIEIELEKKMNKAFPPNSKD